MIGVDIPVFLVCSANSNGSICYRRGNKPLRDTQMDMSWWITVITTLLGIIQTTYAALAYHRDRRALSQAGGEAPNSNFRVMLLFTTLTWSAVALNVWDRHYNSVQIPEAGFASYGVQSQDALGVTVHFRDHVSLKAFKAMLITRVPYSDKDRMTDDWIAKSTLYTIEEPNLVLSTIPSRGHMRFTANAPNAIEYDLVVVPVGTDPDRVKSLQDVEVFGGRILVVASQGGIMGGPPAAPN